MSKKFGKRMIVAMPEKLFDSFKEVCDYRYQNVSEKIRELMLLHIEKEHKNGKKIK